MITSNKTVQYAVYSRDGGSPAYVQDTTTITRPSLEFLTDTLSGAGINGEIDMPTYAQLGSMTYEIGLRRTNPRAVALLSPGTHELETRWVTDTIDTSTGAASVSANKEIVKGFAKSLEGGTLENNASQEANLVLEVAYYKYIQDGETLIEIDKLNNVFLVNGVDYGQAVRDNL